MPKVNKVGQPVASTPASTPPNAFSQPEREVNPAPEPETNNPPATVQTGGLVLPDYLTSTNGSNLPAVAIPEITGYMGWLEETSKNLAACNAAGIQVGEGFINDVNQFIRCHPMEFALLKSKSFRTVMEGKEMKLTYASEDVDDGSNPDAKPHYCCLMLVKVGNKLVPVIGDIRGPKSSAAEKPINAIKSAGTTEWASLSDAHKVSCAFPQPWGRVWARITTSRQISKSNGNPYYRADTVVGPTNATQIQMLIDAFSDEEFVTKMNRANINFEARCQIYINKAREIASSKQG